MKSRILICITAMTLFAALAIPNRRAAQGAPTYTVLYAFTGGADGGSGGSTVVPGVVLDNKGNLYGTTVGGGDLSGCFGSGCGVVFKVDPTGKETVLYSFTGGADGGQPFAGLVRDRAGNLYGTTALRGDPSCFCGVVFKLTP